MGRTHGQTLASQNVDVALVAQSVSQKEVSLTSLCLLQAPDFVDACALMLGKINKHGGVCRIRQNQPGLVEPCLVLGIRVVMACYAHMPIQVLSCASIHACMNAWMLVCMYVRMYVCMYVCRYICTQAGVHV